jgi:hypothetical protein
MGIYESELACGCIAEATTYSDPPFKSYVKSFCDKHAPVVSNVVKYNLRDFRRRYALGRDVSEFFDIRILGTSPIQKRRSIIVRFEILDPDFDISSFRNPVFFSEFEGAPSFHRRPDGIVECIDLFDKSLVYVPGL